MVSSSLSRAVARVALVLAGSCLAASCGGGDSGSGGGGTATATAPRFTSATADSVVENTTGAFYTATASDPQGDPITLSLHSGTDADKFVLETGGALRFNTPPNYDLPIDADGDNVYEVVLRATAGGQSVDLAWKVTVTNDREGIAVNRIATGFGIDAVITAPQHRPDLFIVQQDGTIFRVSSDGEARTEIANAFLTGESGRVMSVGHLNNHVMVMLDLDGKGVYVRAFPLSSYPHTYLEIQLAVDSSITASGALYNESGGLLWAALGDPSGDLAQNDASGYGKLFLVQAYPNCGASVDGIWCMSKRLTGDGIHAPGGGGFYETFSFLIDRGADRKDEVTLYDPDWMPLDFGWPFYEGDSPIRANPPAAVNGPSVVMARSDDFRGASGLVGGVIYAGPIGQLRDKLVFGDISGKIFAISASKLADGILHNSSEVENRTADFSPDTGGIDQPRGIVTDEDGRLFVLDADGELFRVNAS